MLEPGVQPDEIDQLERAHRMIQPELERLVDVARRGDALHQHVERLVADAGVDARRDEARRFAHEDRLFPHPRRDLVDRVERRGRRLERLHDFDELHLVHGIEEVHAGDARRVGQCRRHLGEAQRGRVRRDDRVRRREALDVGKELELDVDSLGRRLDDEIGIGERLPQVAGGAQPAAMALASPRQ